MEAGKEISRKVEVHAERHVGQTGGGKQRKVGYI